MSGSDDKTLRLWDAVSGAHLNTLNGHSNLVMAVAFSPDGTRIVSGSADNTLRLWDAVSGTHLKMLNGHSGWVMSVTFSPDGTQIISGSGDNTLRLWDAVSGTQSNTLHGHSNSITSVAFSPNGTQIMSGSDDKTLQLWDAMTGYNIWIYDKPTPSVQRPHLNWDSQPSFYNFVSNDGWLWAMDPKQRICWIPVAYRPSNVNCLAANGTHIALGSEDGCVIILDLLDQPFFLMVVSI